MLVTVLPSFTLSISYFFKTILINLYIGRLNIKNLSREEACYVLKDILRGNINAVGLQKIANDTSSFNGADE